MTAKLLVRGMLIGLLAGIIAFCFAHWAGEPNVDASIAVEQANEQAHSHTAGHSHEEEGPVSRHTQATYGLFTGITLYSIALGGLFALAFAFAQGRVGRLQGRHLAGVIAACAFVAVVLVPWLKYPANPPAVGSPETIGSRTALFFGMLLISVVGMIAAFIFTRLLRERYAAYESVLGGVALYGIIVLLAGTLLPSVDEVPSDFPADVLFNFRLTSLGINAIVWSILGIGFGLWVDHGRQRAHSSALA